MTNPVAVELGRAEVIKWAKERFGLRALKSTLKGIPCVAAKEAAQLCRRFTKDSLAELTQGKEYEGNRASEPRTQHQADPAEGPGGNTSQVTPAIDAPWELLRCLLGLIAPVESRHLLLDTLGISRAPRRVPKVVAMSLGPTKQHLLAEEGEGVSAAAGIGP
ncbi:hypothetical protein MAPG_00253 [Magnaporthiopsis poae ATCC 64411]|uniref:Uncharacterized protein n=1 Tax=Magnaporthiopsis poae (strain ATCC 64411 / 73-15) TaxID=644358 RepID=A0A0C4DKI0_MAGP6|nr:hypothetical protein MAPG_00253 [Magnaporthiopsis poae ATCC 64411]